MNTGRPWVTVKLGISIDGKVALSNGASRWITGEESRADVQRQRARSSAIMTGSGTVLADDPELTVRAPEIDMLGRRVLRVVCDSRLRTPTTAKLFGVPGAIWILTTNKDEVRRAALTRAGAEVVHIDSNQSGIDLHAALQMLATRGVNELLVEAGPQLAGRLLELGLVDELLVYMAPIVLGADARSMFATPTLESMTARWNFKVHDVARCGADVRLRFRRSADPSSQKVD
jgi:diaminohydroxyphosphoribosylaminopyrimidine deaminase / 5-amino-6-(5-phosphoribosylamino)uracil reductase